ncbi:MAG: PKD domain-containing protein, partial [Flavobacteriales bacterium]|nr:PKD domain-containing protein [Flavobacteriales bacterium]
PEDIVECPWDPEMVNPAHTTELGILDINEEMGYVDVYMVNDEIEIKALQFTVSGIEISSLENLVDPLVFDAELAHDNMRVAALAHGETFLPKYSVPTAIFRLYYSAYTAPEVCVSAIEDAINLQGHNTLTQIGTCDEIHIDFAQFTGNTNVICQGSAVQFTDLSTENANGWYWTFEGGTPSTSTDQHPVVNFAAPGVYSVTLEASNGIISDVEIKTALITVNAASGWFPDADGDGFGDNSVPPMMDCIQPLNAVADNTDCNDGDNGIYPGAAGQHDDIDRNCNGTIDPEEAAADPCLGDFNNDGVVNTTDLLVFLGEYGCTSGCGAADLNNDGVVNTSDLLLFLGAFGTSCQ